LSENIINPTSHECIVSETQLIFFCPTCNGSVTVNTQQIHPVIGVNAICPGCGNVAHVPGSYRAEPVPSDIQITFGVKVPISRYVDWLFSHSTVSSLKQNGELDLLYSNYGLWAFCSECYYKYSPIVLAYTYPLYRMSKDTAGFLLSSSRPEPMKEILALHEGHCPSCSSEQMIIIVADIPDNIRAIIAEQKLREAD